MIAIVNIDGRQLKVQENQNISAHITHTISEPKFWVLCSKSQNSQLYARLCLMCANHT